MGRGGQFTVGRTMIARSKLDGRSLYARFIVVCGAPATSRRRTLATSLKRLSPDQSNSDWLEMMNMQMWIRTVSTRMSYFV